MNRKGKKNRPQISVCFCSEFWPVQSWSSFPHGHWQRQLSLWATGRCELQPESCLNSDQRLKVPISPLFLSKKVSFACFYKKGGALWRNNKHKLEANHQPCSYSDTILSCCLAANVHSHQHALAPCCSWQDPCWSTSEHPRVSSLFEFSISILKKYTVCFYSSLFWWAAA